MRYYIDRMEMNKGEDLNTRLRMGMRMKRRSIFEGGFFVGNVMEMHKKLSRLVEKSR